MALDRTLDAARGGPLYFVRPEIASMVVASIHYQGDVMGRYELHNYVVMANHVHILITPLRSLSKVMQSLKRFTAREGNRMLGLTGQTFWADESYDRLIRDREEFHRIARYIELNPVRAGLVAAPEKFRFSSAARAD
ncbi:MAG TPA: transposase [Bryobacteraceae bacterium]|nr:transposase [Bryobacteraceae bacterium]